MTNVDNKDRLLEQDTRQKQQQNKDQKPFHVVLIDIKRAADEKVIHCVEKPLEGTEDLKYVAISYRWGELQETTTDTGVGYLASIISFNLDNFFSLCRSIAEEDDLQFMDYVWVDTICINQANYQQRKATIYHMTDIYQRANYILAVPDLHLAYLQNARAINRRIITGSLRHAKYIHYLLQGNMQKLFEIDQQWLDEYNVPNDQRLRHMLLEHTEYFTIGLTTCSEHRQRYDSEALLQHLYESITRTSHLSSINDDDGNVDIDSIPIGDDDDADISATIQTVHTCNDPELCPYKRILYGDDNYVRSKFSEGNLEEWKNRVLKRSQDIRKSIEFLMELLVDWSSRVWVVSEFHIAKSKSNKMKYWFIQLNTAFNNGIQSFLTFDFNDETFFSTCGGGVQNVNADGQSSHICPVTGDTSHTYNPYLLFHSTMRQQLSQQTFLQKILKSKASKHEDRFHAILPSSEYKSLLNDKTTVDNWNNNIKSLVSVKLELYKWMNTKNKLELLFLSAFHLANHQVLPSFATAPIEWDGIDSHPIVRDLVDQDFPGNFDLSKTSTIQLLQEKDESKQESSYKLNIKPRESYRLVGNDMRNKVFDRNDVFLKVPGLNLMTDDDDNDDDDDFDDFDVIIIPIYSKQAMKDYFKSTLMLCGEIVAVTLIGCMTKNRWTLALIDMPLKHNFWDMLFENENEENWEICHGDENSPGFNIY